MFIFFFFQAEDGIRGPLVTGVQTCALPISPEPVMGLEVAHLEERCVGDRKLGERPLAAAANVGGRHRQGGRCLRLVGHCCSTTLRRLVDFGLSRSSNALPTSVNDSTTRTTDTAGGAMYHHAPRPGAPDVCAELRISPHDGWNGSP